jgi:hypothetical protein
MSMNLDKAGQVKMAFILEMYQDIIKGHREVAADPTLPPKVKQIVLRVIAAYEDLCVILDEEIGG